MNEMYEKEFKPRSSSYNFTLTLAAGFLLHIRIPLIPVLCALPPVSKASPNTI